MLRKSKLIDFEKNTFSLEFINNEDEWNAGRGRTIRRVKLDVLNEIRIIKDVSLLEIYQ